ncbi:embigin isoform X2 [Brachyhypopomus gauderio]|uniref:embigin isoform X2 n=1 Tax=Brachyhypopomus gauderio TaxID=698409 RepID=UPI00404386E7
MKKYGTEMLRFSQVRRGFHRSLRTSNIKAMDFLLLFLYWHGVSTEAVSSPSVDGSAVTPETIYVVGHHKTIASKGQSHVIIEELEILKPQKIELSCIIYDIPKNPTSIHGHWRKNGNEIIDSHQTVYKDDKQTFILKSIYDIQVNDLGNYSCIFSYEDKQEQVIFRLKVPVMKDKRDKPIVSYVGDSVVLDCKIKRIPVTWQWYKNNGTEKVLINATADPKNYNILLAKNVTKLTVLNLTQEDAGKYTCSAVFEIKSSESHVHLKVLSFTEPLKPFIGIAVEVVILVTLILLFERYGRSKHDALPTENGPNTEQTDKLG